MELSLSGNALKTFIRSITCLARIGSELVLQASASKLQLHTLNSSRSAYQTIFFTADFFDRFSVSNSSSSTSFPIQCSFLLKSITAILRTPFGSIDRLVALLPSPDSSKLQWTLHCLNGVKKSYWISCNVEPDIEHLTLDRRRFPSSLVVRPRDMTRLLANFQSSLQEITVIATEPAIGMGDGESEIGGKAVELRSYIDPTKDDSDTTLHTQLWIDPTEEFVQYNHIGDPVDVTFGVKELKAFLTFCEGCEVDIHLFFEKAGEPILMAPRFGLDDGCNSDFDANLVLATMLVSQLTEGNTADDPCAAPAQEPEDARAPNASSVPEHPSLHTKIWSELSGSAAKSSEGNKRKQVQLEGNPSSSVQNVIQMSNTMNAHEKLLPQVDVSNVYPVLLLQIYQHYLY